MAHVRFIITIQRSEYVDGTKTKYLKPALDKLSFYVKTEQTNNILEILINKGVGSNNSSISVLPCSLFFSNDEGFTNTVSNPLLSNSLTNENPERTIWEKFIQRSILVSNVLESVERKALLTFDYLMLLLIAALTAALASVENNQVILVASMLISPMMGPIVAGMFGTCVPDKKLQKLGFLNGLFSTLFCVAIGLVVGAVVESLNIYQPDHWPTQGMGELRSLGVGVVVAILSGAAIAIAILMDITESVIGAAISAALLPPAVNAGLFWGMAAVNAFKKLEPIKNPVRFANPSLEYVTMGAISLCLTMLNIIFLYITGILILKLNPHYTWSPGLSLLRNQIAALDMSEDVASVIVRCKAGTKYEVTSPAASAVISASEAVSPVVSIVREVKLKGRFKITSVPDEHN